MALFLETQSISKEILELIKEAKKKIILISPYFKTSELLRERIRTKSDNSKLTEFTIIYGKEDLKESELEWMKGIKNLNILEKKNLHAKCYLNENRAIICSMNLYDYSQQNNIEMGILITKKDDPIAFRSLLDEIFNLKHNSINILNNQIVTFDSLTPNQKLNYKLINELVGYKLKDKKKTEDDILTTAELISLASCENLNTESISKLLPEKKFDEYCDGILKKMNYSQKFTLGKIDRIIRSQELTYPKIIFKLLNGNVLELDCTENNLPKKENIYVAVRLNETWFNEYYTLDN